MLHRILTLPKRAKIHAGIKNAGGYNNLGSLVFPSNVSGSDKAAPMVALKFTAPHNDSFPLWGNTSSGVSIFRRYYPVQQTGYYACFWYADDSSFEESKLLTGINYGYYGFHPYPQNASNTGTTHYWEIATDNGGDFLNTDAGTPLTVQYDRWYRQALTVTRTNASSKTFKFYIDLDDVRAGTIITATVTTASYGENSPPQAQPQLTLGDSPWYGTYQHERASGRIGEHLIFSGITATQQQCIDQGALLLGANTSLLPALASSIWLGKKGYSTVDDLTCNFSTGRSFSWIDGANKGTLGSLS